MALVQCEQWVILGAHYDHVGWTTDSGGGAIVLNGADDNASGTTVLLVAADLLARWLAAHPEAAPSRRSIMFQAYGAEEEGMLGSRYYVGNPTVPGTASSRWSTWTWWAACTMGSSS